MSETYLHSILFGGLFVWLVVNALYQRELERRIKNLELRNPPPPSNSEGRE